MITSIEEKEGVKTVLINLPLSISKSDHNLEYYDDELKKYRFTSSDLWFVSDNKNTPPDMDLKCKQFREVKGAIEYAKLSYLKYLRSEISRIKGEDEISGV